MPSQTCPADTQLYHRWLTDWPPLASALLAAAERTGAVLATVSNLYGYGPVDAPITPATPLAATHPKLRLRAQMWRDALAAHEVGRIRATEVRGSDYIEANSIFSSNPALTVRELATRFTTLRGLPAPKLTAVPYPALWAAGPFSPMMRELRTTNYQWTRPFVLDSTLTERTFGLTPTPIDTALADVPITDPLTGPR